MEDERPPSSARSTQHADTNGGDDDDDDNEKSSRQRPQRPSTVHFAAHIARVYKSSALAEMGDRLATIDMMGRKVEEGCCARPFPWGGGLGHHHNVAWAEAYLRTE